MDGLDNMKWQPTNSKHNNKRDNYLQKPSLLLLLFLEVLEVDGYLAANEAVECGHQKQWKQKAWYGGEEAESSNPVVLILFFGDSSKVKVADSLIAIRTRFAENQTRQCQQP